VGAPSDSKQQGLMLYTLRYEMELRDFKSALADVKEPTVNANKPHDIKRIKTIQSSARGSAIAASAG
jgi:non-homologous end joining protein Ku